MTATLVVREIETGVRPVHLRMPFRFGSVTLHACPQLFLRATIEVIGHGTHVGHAAELMMPKWFDKRPEFTLTNNVTQLADSVETAAQTYLDDSPTTSFELFARHYAGIRQQGRRQGFTELTSSYGEAVLERAVIDALCKALEISFFEAAHQNVFGLQAEACIPDMNGFDFSAWLASLQPLASLEARHTVGLLDELGCSHMDEVALPRSLTDVIARYGNRIFKIKLAGDPLEDVQRAADVLAVIDPLVPDYRFTLDGNEQYADTDKLDDLLMRLPHLPLLKKRPAALLYIEQPIPRDICLDLVLSATQVPAPLLMDEADGTLDAFVRGREQGWRGVSSKACKGLYKSIVNRARCDLWNDQARRDGKLPAFFMSAEDLTCQAGLAVQQDLAIAAVLGLAHCERNGHHYVDGFGDSPPNEQQAFALLHNDLYETSSGHPRLAIHEGRLAIDSLFNPGFAHRVDPDWHQMQPLCRAGELV